MPLHGISPENGNFAILDTLMEFARPKEKDLGKLLPTITHNLHERLKKCAVQTGQPLVDNCFVIKEVLKEYGKNKDLTPFYKELDQLSKKDGFWDTQYYAEVFTSLEAEAKPSVADTGKEESKTEVPESKAKPEKETLESKAKDKDVEKKDKEAKEEIKKDKVGKDKKKEEKKKEESAEDKGKKDKKKEDKKKEDGGKSKDKEKKETVHKKYGVDNKEEKKEKKSKTPKGESK